MLTETVQDTTTIALIEDNISDLLRPEIKNEGPFLLKAKADMNLEKKTNKTLEKIAMNRQIIIDPISDNLKNGKCLVSDAIYTARQAMGVVTNAKRNAILLLPDNLSQICVMNNLRISKTPYEPQPGRGVKVAPVLETAQEMIAKHAEMARLAYKR